MEEPMADRPKPCPNYGTKSPPPGREATRLLGSRKRHRGVATSLPGHFNVFFSSGSPLCCRVLMELFLLLLVAELSSGSHGGEDLSVLERLIVRGRCQARCNKQFGYQERHRQIDLFDHYMPFTCRQGHDFHCSQCSQACLAGSFNLTRCAEKCNSSVCVASCDFLNHAFLQEIDGPGYPSVQARNLPRTARSLTVTKPRVICTYTTLPSLSSNPKSLVRMYWNVRDVTNVSTSVPLTFILAIQRCDNTSDCPNSSPWNFFGKTTNFSVIPVHDLEPNTSYIMKVLAVHWSGYVKGSVLSDVFTTPPVQNTLDTPTDLAVSKQYVRAGQLHAVVSWRAPPAMVISRRTCPNRRTVAGGCFFRLYSMPPRGTYEMMEIKYWGQLKYELRRLHFNSDYTIQVYNSDEHFLIHSKPVNITFHTIESCLKASDFDYNLCPPEKPSKVNLSSSQPYLVNSTDQVYCDILVTWDLPRHRRHRNFVSNYSLSFRKAPDMHNAETIQPHRGTFILPATSTNYTIRQCHWDGIYEVTMRAQSRGGRSEEVTVSITLALRDSAVLGNGYADYYDNADQELEDNTVLYAAAAPVILGVVAVAVCILYRLKAARTKNIVFHREEINPIYECAVTKEEAQLLVPDEYEIDFNALQITETIGEGAFGKVLKAEMDFALAPVRGCSSGRKTVAVKMLKEHATPDERRNLLLEIDAMKQLGHHQNIVSIIACVTCFQRPCLVMHYCPLGDLRTFLRTNRKKTPSKDSGSRSTDTSSSSGRRGPLNSEDSGISYASKGSLPSRNRESVSFVRGELTGATRGDLTGAAMGSSTAAEYTSMDSSDNSALFLNGQHEVVSQTKLLSFARQIAMGMEYLAEKKFIHRDLAARNILLYNHRQLKISDFGLARDVYETSIYQPTSARKLPYKWMPIESIFDQIFTIKSDVWSFGIVLWEIVTLGGCPYPGIPNKDLFRLLKEGYRMEKPENCSLEIYKMMLSCWHPRPEDRPTFTELRNTLECSLEKAQSYIDLSVAVSQDYYDQDNECSDSTVPNGSRPVSVGADVHVCQLFHNNSSDRNLTLRLAQSVILEAPASEDAEQSPSSSSPSSSSSSSSPTQDREASERQEDGKVPASKKKTKDKESPSSSCGDDPLGGIWLRDKKEAKTSSSLIRVGENSSCRVDQKEYKDGDGGDGVSSPTANARGEEEDALLDTTDVMRCMHNLPTSPRSGSGSSSTELTCDCDSPDNLSETSMPSEHGDQVKIHHAPSLTYGILSLIRAGKDGLARKGHKQNKRHSRSLTDVDKVGMEVRPGLTPACSYNRRTDAWACAL